MPKSKACMGPILAIHGNMVQIAAFDVTCEPSNPFIDSVLG